MNGNEPNREGRCISGLVFFPPLCIASVTSFKLDPLSFFLSLFFSLCLHTTLATFLRTSLPFSIAIIKKTTYTQNKLLRLSCGLRYKKLEGQYFSQGRVKVFLRLLVTFFFFQVRIKVNTTWNDLKWQLTT